MKKDEAPVTLMGEADKIWQEIKGKDLQLFSLPGQFVSKYCTPQFVEPSKLYLVITTGAAIAALEELLKADFEIAQAGKYITVTRLSDDDKKKIAPIVTVRY